MRRNNSNQLQNNNRYTLAILHDDRRTRTRLKRFERVDFDNMSYILDKIVGANKNGSHYISAMLIKLTIKNYAQNKVLTDDFSSGF